jgi:hypothetical protein
LRNRVPKNHTFVCKNIYLLTVVCTPPPPPPPRDNASPYICRYRLHAALLRPIINALSLYCAGNKPAPRNALFNQNSNISRQLSSCQLFSRSCSHASCPHASCPHAAELVHLLASEATFFPNSSICHHDEIVDLLLA